MGKSREPFPQDNRLDERPVAWTTNDGRLVLIQEMGDRHLDNTMAFIVRKMGPGHMVYMMGKLLVADPYELRYDHHFKLWRIFLAMSSERERRNELSIKVPDQD